MYKYFLLPSLVQAQYYLKFQQTDDTSGMSQEGSSEATYNDTGNSSDVTAQFNHDEAVDLLDNDSGAAREAPYDRWGLSTKPFLPASVAFLGQDRNSSQVNFEPESTIYGDLLDGSVYVVAPFDQPELVKYEILVARQGDNEAWMPADPNTQSARYENKHVFTQGECSGYGDETLNGLWVHDPWPKCTGTNRDECLNSENTVVGTDTFYYTGPAGVETELTFLNPGDLWASAALVCTSHTDGSEDGSAPTLTAQTNTDDLAQADPRGKFKLTISKGSTDSNDATDCDDRVTCAVPTGAVVTFVPEPLKIDAVPPNLNDCTEVVVLPWYFHSHAVGAADYGASTANAAWAAATTHGANRTTNGPTALWSLATPMWCPHHTSESAVNHAGPSTCETNRITCQVPTLWQGVTNPGAIISETEHGTPDPAGGDAAKAAEKLARDAAVNTDSDEGGDYWNNDDNQPLREGRGWRYWTRATGTSVTYQCGTTAVNANNLWTCEVDKGTATLEDDGYQRDYDGVLEGAGPTEEDDSSNYDTWRNANPSQRMDRLGMRRTAGLTRANQRLDFLREWVEMQTVGVEDPQNPEDLVPRNVFCYCRTPLKADVTISDVQSWYVNLNEYGGSLSSTADTALSMSLTVYTDINRSTPFVLNAAKSNTLPKSTHKFYFRAETNQLGIAIQASDCVAARTEADAVSMSGNNRLVMLGRYCPHAAFDFSHDNSGPPSTENTAHDFSFTKFRFLGQPEVHFGCRIRACDTDGICDINNLNVDSPACAGKYPTTDFGSTNRNHKDPYRRELQAQGNQRGESMMLVQMNIGEDAPTVQSLLNPEVDSATEATMTTASNRGDARFQGKAAQDAENESGKTSSNADQIKLIAIIAGLVFAVVLMAAYGYSRCKTAKASSPQDKAESARMNASESMESSTKGDKYSVKVSGDVL